MIDIFKIRNEMIEDVAVENAYGTPQDYIVKLADERFEQFLMDEYEKFDEQDWEDVLTYAFESDATDKIPLFEFIVDNSDGIITSEKILDDSIQYENFSSLPFLFTQPIMNSRNMKNKLRDALITYEDVIFNQINRIREDTYSVYSDREKREQILFWMNEYRMISNYLDRL